MFTAIRNFFTAPQYEDDLEKTQDAQTTHRVAVALLGLALFSIPFIFLLRPPEREYALYGTVMGVLLWFFTINLVRRQHNTIAKLIILAVNTFNLLGVTYIVGGLARPTMTTTLFLLAMATLLFPRRGAMIYGAIILALGTALFFMGIVGLVPEPTIPSSAQSFYFIFAFTLVSVSIILAIASANSQRRLEVILERENELRERNVALGELRNQLEIRVMERTEELEENAKRLEKRAKQFEAIAQLARTITSIQDLGTLLPRITQMVSQQFGFYHVGLFLLDESRQYAVLSAANSEGGQRMLARKHRLGVGKTGIVGYVTATGNPRIALDTGADSAYFINPDLPDTRSEMALPLRIGSQIIGALDAQSTESNAFSEDDIEVLSILADEVSIAIENARLYEESRRVLADAQSAFGEFTKGAWRQITGRRKSIGYEIAGTTIRPLEKPLSSAEIQQAIQDGMMIINDKAKVLAVPIKLRDQVIGTMNIKLPEERQWDADELDITQALAERLGFAIESAALLEESRRRAARESAISAISAKVSATPEIERIMQVAVGELRQALGASEVVLKLEKNGENE